MKKTVVSGMAAGMAGILILLFLTVPCAAADPNAGMPGMSREKVDLYAGKLMEALTKDRLGLLMAMPVKFYFAGASFQKSVLAPVDRVAEYESGEARRLMSALYFTDGAYSQLCRKKKLAAGYFDAWNELTESFVTLFSPELKADLFDTTKTVLAKYRKVSPEKLRDLMAEVVARGNTQLVTSSLGIEVVVDGFYASLIEVMYLSSSMIIPLDEDTKLVPRFKKAAREQMMVADDVVTAMADDPEFADICNIPERRKVIASLKAILDRETFKMADVSEVHGIVQPIRRSIIDMK